MKPDINSVDVHPQLSHIGHPVNGGPVGAGLLWLLLARKSFQLAKLPMDLAKVLG